MRVSKLKVQSSKFKSRRPEVKEIGQSLFEVVFSVAIVALLVVGVVALAATSVRNSTFSRNTSLGNAYAQEAVEWLREERDKDWDTFKSHAIASTGWCLKTLSWSSPTFASACGTSDYLNSTIFIRSLSFTCFHDGPPAISCSAGSTVNNIEGLVVVSWVDGQGVHDVRVTTRLANWIK
jgi:hypothetical protein